VLAVRLWVWAEGGFTGWSRHCAGEVKPGLPTRLLGFRPRGSAYAEAVRNAARRTAEVLVFQSFKSLLMDLGHMQEAGNPFHHVSHMLLGFFHSLVPSFIAITVFSSHQFHGLRQRFVTLREFLQPFVDCHSVSPARWIRAKISLPESAPIVNGQNHLVLSPGTGIFGSMRQVNGGFPLIQGAF
jgi:hypothetical protein